MCELTSVSPLNESGLTESRHGLCRDLLQFSRQGSVVFFEGETRLAAHARFQPLRKAGLQSRILIDAHEMVADARLSDLGPGDRDERPPGFAAPGFERGRSHWCFQTESPGLITNHRKTPALRLQDCPEGTKDRFEL